MKTFAKIMCLAGLALTAATLQAAPTIYGFKAITNNSALDPYIGENQLSLSVDAYGDNQVLFSFSNNGLNPSPCSITRIYVEDGILALASIQNSTGVLFGINPSPKNLPGGNPIGFEADKTLSAGSLSPTQPNGVNPGESLNLVFNIFDGYTIDEIINRLNQGIGTTSNVAGDIRVGIHVQGFADGQSESFVLKTNTPPDTPPVVPAPSAIILAGIGISCLWKTSRHWR